MLFERKTVDKATLVHELATELMYARAVSRACNLNPDMDYIQYEQKYVWKASGIIAVAFRLGIQDKVEEYLKTELQDKFDYWVKFHKERIEEFVEMHKSGMNRQQEIYESVKRATAANVARSEQDV